MMTHGLSKMISLPSYITLYSVVNAYWEGKKSSEQSWSGTFKRLLVWTCCLYM